MLEKMTIIFTQIVQKVTIIKTNLLSSKNFYLDCKNSKNLSIMLIEIFQIDHFRQKLRKKVML